MFGKKLSFKQKVHLQIWLSFSCIIILAVSITWFARQQTLPQGLMISNWDVSGMTFEQFYAVFGTAMEQLERQKLVLHTPLDKTPQLTTTFSQLGLKTNAEELRQDIKKLTQGTILQRAHHRWFMRNKKLHLTLVLDKSKIDNTVQTHWQAMLKRQPADAKRTITADDRVEYIPDQPAYRIDNVHLHSDLDRWLYKSFYAWIDKKLLDSSEKEIRHELPLTKIPPAVTVEMLKQQGIERRIMQFSTSVAGGSEGRLHNIRSTAKVVHDTLLAPGDVFDYSKVIEEAQKKYGFRNAPVILDGKLVQGIGGGICQISTTLYNAAIRTGLEIVERRNHSLPITYAPLGQDATYSTGYINFKFRNSLDSHLLIRTEMDHHKVTVKLFGTMDHTIKYEIESKIIQTIEPPVQYVHDASLGKGARKVLVRGKRGYVVDTFRYKKQNGKTVATEKLSRDRYQPQPTIIAMNTPPLQNSPKKRNSRIEDGVYAPVIEDGVSALTFE